MAKKRKAPEPDAAGYLNTGIYRRRAVRPKPSPDENKASLDALFASDDDPRPGVREWLAEYRRGLGEWLQPHLEVVAQGDNNRVGARYPLDIGAGRQAYMLRPGLLTETHEAVLDGIDAMRQLDVLEGQITAEGELRAAHSLAWIVDAAFKLGRAAERAGVRSAEPDARIGAASRDGGSKGVKITNEAHDELRPKYQPRVDELVASGVSYEQAKPIVAREFGVSQYCVRDNTTNPKPRNKGRHG